MMRLKIIYKIIAAGVAYTTIVLLCWSKILREHS